MNKNEQDLIQKIAEKTEDIQVPGGLEPEQIPQMLEKKGRKRKLTPYRIGALAAACLVLVAGVAVYGNVRGDRSTEGTGTEETVSKEQKIALAESYEEVYGYIEKYTEEMGISSST